jgi:hypothetical protein
MRRLISATLLLYPRAVRRGHGPELESLVQDLIDHDGASRHRVMTRLALDGLIQRLTTRATGLVVAGTLLLTSVGGLAVSDFAAASARGAVPAHTTGVTRQTQPQVTRPRALHPGHDKAGHASRPRLRYSSQ